MLNQYHNPVIQLDTSEIVASVDAWDKLRNKAVFITGANGMLGRYCVYTLLKLNDEQGIGVHVIANVRSLERGEAVFGDLVERDDFELKVQSVDESISYEESVDFLIHAASQASPYYFDNDPVGTIKANTLGVFNTLDFARAKGASYLFVSTREIYGQPLPDQEWFVESDWGQVNPVDVRSCYSEGKRAGETIVVSYKKQYDMDVKIARLSHTYGPGLSLSDARVQAGFAAAIMNDKDIVLKSTGALQRTYTYIADATAALFYILLQSDDLVYNIAARNALVTIKELAEAFIAARPEKHLQLVFDLDDKQAKAGWSPVTGGNLDSSRLENLGWQPNVTLLEGIDRTLSFFEFVDN